MKLLELIMKLLGIVSFLAVGISIASASIAHKRPRGITNEQVKNALKASTRVVVSLS